MLPEKIIYIGVLINLIGAFWYIKTIVYGETRPNLVSWFLWMLAPFVGVFLQIKAGAGLSFLGTFMAGFCPLLVIIFSLIKRNAFWEITKFDIICGSFSVLALILYILTNRLGISILFAIISDGLAAIPTIRKAWKFPETETGFTYMMGIINHVLALLIIKNWIFSIYSFSIYFIIMNLTIIFSIYHKKIFKMKNKDKINVVFKNQPKLIGYAVESESDEKRLALVPKIEQFIKSHKLFKNKKVEITFFQKGVSSLVCWLESGEEKYVLKIQIRMEKPQGEALFLKAWENVGVTVPHIYETGKIDEHAHILMQYIDAKTLDMYSEKELIDKKIFYKMGQTLQKMHLAKANGYGKLFEGNIGEYPDFKSWIYVYPQTQKDFTYTKKHNLLLSETCGSLDRALEILITYIEADPGSVYCHFDFSPGNIFDTEPITVFDPVSILNHPLIDLGKSITQIIAVGYTSKEAIDQLIAGYFENNKRQLDRQVIQASALLNSHMKFAFWHKREKTIQIARVMDYLIENKKLLE